MGLAFLSKSEHEHSTVFNYRLTHSLIFLSAARFWWSDNYVVIPIASIISRAFVRSALNDKPIGSYHLYRYSYDW
jgi:hypothetical protein